jgi:choline transport protein
MGATNNFIGANYVLGIAQLNHPSYTIERWHTVLVTYLIVILAAVSNIYVPHLLDRISKGMLVWNITAFLVCFITILATNDHKQTPSFVFSEFRNSTGFSAPYTAIIGLLQSAFGMCCYDSSAHMTEELKDARKQAPRAIVMSVYMGAVTGFVFLISLCFCIGDLETTASTPTGVPAIEIFFNSTQSIGGASALASFITVIVMISTNSLMATGSRAVYAFARDHGLPFSTTFSKVWPKTAVPVYAVLLTAVVQIAFNSIYFGTLTGFNTVISIATQGFCKSPLHSQLFLLQ